jgi:hypothetical protein
MRSLRAGDGGLIVAAPGIFDALCDLIDRAFDTASEMRRARSAG